jgi:hypothetical protein
MVSHNNDIREEELKTRKPDNFRHAELPPTMRHTVDGLSRRAAERVTMEAQLNILGRRDRIRARTNC